MYGLISKLEKKFIFNHEDYVFYNQMTIDWFSCSFLFVLKNKEYVAKILKKSRWIKYY